MEELINWARFAPYGEASHSPRSFEECSSSRMTDNPRSTSKIAAAQRTCLAMTLEGGRPWYCHRERSDAISNKDDDIDGRIARLKDSLLLAGRNARPTAVGGVHPAR